MNLEKVTQSVIEIAKEAGRILLDGFTKMRETGVVRPARIEQKSSQIDWVTEYDEASEAYVMSQLQTLFPTHTFVGEESGLNDNASDFAWYVDPLDGTTNFAHGFPIWCVSIALYEQDKPLLGIVHDPIHQNTYYAIRGQGAFMQAETGNTRVLKVSQTVELRSALLATGFPYDRFTSEVDNLHQTAVFLKNIQGLRRAGSAALDLCFVADGRLDGYWEFKVHSWDIAAGLLILQEAGGQISEMDGAPLQWQQKMNIVASNGRLHSAMLSTLEKANNGTFN